MRCQNCFALSAAEARYCSACGLALVSTGNNVRANPLSQQRELKYSTVLFADIVASTEIIAQLDPEQAMQVLKPALSAMREAVERFNGTVFHLLGDGLMALFGVPQAQEGHALLACHAAFAIRDAIARRSGGLRVRQGLHSGLVVFEAAHSESLNHVDAHGVAIHIASRLQMIAGPSEICISRECYDLIAPFCHVQPLGLQTLRGVPNPVEAFRLEDLRPAVTQTQFLGQSLTPLHGRQAELDALKRAATGSREEGANTVIVFGQAGTGKSRLCFEFARWCRRTDIPVLDVSVQLYGATTPLQPVIALVRQMIGLEEVEAEAAAGAIARYLARCGVSDDASLAIACDFLGAPPLSKAASDLAPLARRARLLEIFRRIVRTYAHARAVVVIEDLHWIDEASKSFIVALREAIQDTAVCLVLTCRSAESAGWLSGLEASTLTLADLDAATTRRIIEELVGARADLEGLRDRVAERSGGNPFFAEELVRSLAQTGALVGNPGAFAPGAGPVHVALPMTLQVLVSERTDRLPRAHRATLCVASVVANDISSDVLALVVGAPVEQVQAQLAELCELGFLQIQFRAGSATYAFRHPLIREAVYSTQLKSDKALLHAAIARAIQVHHHEQLDELAGLIAFHLEASGDLQRAAEFAARAARRVGSMHPAQASRHWHDARRLLHECRRTAANDALLVMANAQIAWLAWREGMVHQPAEPYIAEALQLAEAAAPDMTPLLLFTAARISGADGGSADRYVAEVHRALGLVDGVAAPGRVATLYTSLVQAYNWAGLLREALRASDEALIRVPHVQRFEQDFLGYSVEHWALSLRVQVLVRMARYGEARALLDRLMALGEGLIDPTVEFIRHLASVDLGLATGDAALARAHADQVSRIRGRSPTPYLQAYDASCRGKALAAAGQHEQAIGHWREALTVLRAARAALEIEPELLALTAEAEARIGRRDASAQTATEAIATARARAARLPECRATIVAAAVESRLRSGPDEGLFAQAQALLDETGAAMLNPLMAQARAGTLSR